MNPPAEPGHLGQDPERTPDAPTGPGARRAGRWLATVAAAALPFVALHAIGFRRAFAPATYLPLHTLVELAIALVSFATFAVQWYAASSRAFYEARARFIGAAFLAAAIFETLHILVFPGMPGLLGPSSVERGIVYWLLGRIWIAGALLVAAFLSPESEHPLLRRGPLIALNLAAVALAVGLESRLPPSSGLFFRPGGGLTPLKIGLELGVAGLCAAGAILHLRRWLAGGDRTALRLATALAVNVLAEVSFTLYASAYDAFNLLGHAYALAAAALMFDGLFAVALLEPYRRLDATTRALFNSNARLEELRALVEGELARTIARLAGATEREGRARAELEATFAAAPGAIVVCDVGGQIRRANEAAERLLGYTHGEYATSPRERWARLAAQTPDGKPVGHEESPVLRALGGEHASGTFSIERRDGRRVWVSLSAAPLRGADGAIQGAVAAAADLSQIQELESQREDLLRAVSHDLRNPLQIMVLQAERLTRLLGGPEHERERASAERIIRASQQMGIMIRDLVEAARFESGRIALSREPVALGPFLARLLQQAAGALDTARVAVEVEPDLPAADADPARLERVLTNLVGNALKYSPADALVRVTASARDDALVIAVADRGPGIDPGDLPRLFDRFYRGRSTGSSEGLGLGLYIVRMIVDAHGGRVWADSAPGHGATFSFTLPVAPRGGAEEAGS
jgi:PAS domain S-box-containing protein